MSEKIRVSDQKVKVKITRNDTSLSVFRALRKGRLSGAEIANSLGISRTAVWKAIEKIRSSGYTVESKRGRGYVLTKTPEFPVYEVAELCFSKGVEEFYFFSEVDSTNSFLKNLISERPVRAVAVALEQTAGRGRLGRVWVSKRGGLYLSLTHRVSMNLDEIPRITLCTGVAVCKAIQNVCNCDASLKWPNDIILNGKKLGGILCELCGESDSVWVIIGIGVNVKNEVPENAINLSAYNVTVGDLCKSVLNSVFHHLSELPEKWDTIREEWIKLAEPMLGRKVEVYSAGKRYTGISRGIDDSGALLLESNGKKIRVFSGDCFYV